MSLEKELARNSGIRLSISPTPRVEAPPNVSPAINARWSGTHFEPRLPAQSVIAKPDDQSRTLIADRPASPSLRAHAPEAMTAPRDRVLLSERNEHRVVPSQVSGLPPDAARNASFSERLFEQGRLLVPISKPEMRLVAPAPLADDSVPEPFAALQPRERKSAEARSEKFSDSERPSVMQAAPAPQIDMNAVVEKVYLSLVRRQQAERERRGLL